MRRSRLELAIDILKFTRKNAGASKSRIILGSGAPYSTGSPLVKSMVASNLITAKESGKKKTLTHLTITQKGSELLAQYRKIKETIGLEQT